MHCLGIKYNRQARKVKAEIAERSERIASIRASSVLDTYAGQGAEWNTWNVDVQRSIISTLLESVTVNRWKGGRLPDLEVLDSPGLAFEDKAENDAYMERYFAELAKLNARVQIR